MSVDEQSFPRATHTGELHIADAVIPCAVLEDGRRVLTQQGFLKAIGRARSAKGGQGATDGVIPVLAAKNLQAFVDAELKEALRPVEFRTVGGRPAFGFSADTLPKVCNVYLKARDANALHEWQGKIAKQCDLLMRGLATVGIVALVDEATGYQYDRADDALVAILNDFISKELRQWVRTFSLDYYRELFRLRNLTFDEFTTKRPIIIAQDTNNIVYDRLAPGLRAELQRLTPKDDRGRRRHKFHQRLSEDIGHPKLREHLAVVTAFMKISPDMSTFIQHLDQVKPRFEELQQPRLPNSAPPLPAPAATG